MPIYLGIKAVDLLRVGEAADLDPEEYVRRFTLACERWTEKAILRKAKEMTERGYLVPEEGRWQSYRLSDKGRQALVVHLGNAAAAPCVVYREELAQMAKEAGSHYPEECCGVILERIVDPSAMACRLDGRDGDTQREVMPCVNAQADLHRQFPKLFRKDARQAFAISVEDMREIGKRQKDGWRLAVIYHSHVETPPTFSKDDAQKALKDGEPAWPGTDFVVLGISKGEDTPERPINKAGAYRWNHAAREFLPVRLQVEALIESRACPSDTPVVA